MNWIYQDADLYMKRKYYLNIAGYVDNAAEKFTYKRLIIYTVIYYLFFANEFV